MTSILTIKFSLVSLIYPLLVAPRFQGFCGTNVVLLRIRFDGGAEKQISLVARKR
jgi:hypothetical protein